MRRLVMKLNENNWKEYLKEQLRLLDEEESHQVTDLNQDYLQEERLLEAIALHAKRL